MLVDPEGAVKASKIDWEAGRGGGGQNRDGTRARMVELAEEFDRYNSIGAHQILIPFQGLNHIHG